MQTRVDPENTNAMILIGKAYANKGDDELALEWYRKIEFEELKDPTVLYNIGTRFYNMANYEEALKYYKRSVEIKDKGRFFRRYLSIGFDLFDVGKK